MRPNILQSAFNHQRSKVHETTNLPGLTLGKLEDEKSMAPLSRNKQCFKTPVTDPVAKSMKQQKLKAERRGFWNSWISPGDSDRIQVWRPRSEHCFVSASRFLALPPGSVCRIGWFHWFKHSELSGFPPDIGSRFAGHKRHQRPIGSPSQELAGFQGLGQQERRQWSSPGTTYQLESEIQR